jgi:hypothetical protein
MQNPEALMAKAPTDTIFAGGFGAGAALYPSGSGYIAGNNNFGDVSKAQEFQLTTGIIVESVLLWFGGGVFDSNDPNSALNVRLYAMGGPGTISTGNTNGAPGLVLDEVSVLISDIDTSSSLTGAINVMFPTPVWVPSGFAAGINFDDASAGDTLGLVSSTNGFVGAIDRSWEEWNDNTWHSIQSAWQNVAFDLAIFPVVDASSVGIGEMGSLNGMRMSFLNGNPANNVVNIGYEVENDATMEFVVFNAKGEQVLIQTIGNRAAGGYQLSFDVNSWADGTYYCTMKANGQPLTKKLIVRH